MSKGINLLDYKNDLRKKDKSHVHNWLRLSSILLLFGVSASSIVFFILIALSPLPELNKQQENASIILTEMVPDIIKLQLVKDRVNQIQVLDDNRLKYHLILQELDKIRPSDVDLETFTIGEEKLSFSIISSSLSSINSFLTKLSSSDISKSFLIIEIPRIAVDKETGQFTAEVSVANL